MLAILPAQRRARKAMMRVMGRKMKSGTGMRRRGNLAGCTEYRGVVRLRHSTQPTWETKIIEEQVGATDCGDDDIS
jgi:hypothetical protein